MRTTTATCLACVSIVTLLSACGSSNGHYDANGKYINTSRNTAVYNIPPVQQASEPNAPYGAAYDYNAPAYTDKYVYTRRGYYDAEGHYIAENDDANVPQNMFPPRGMCRVWFVERMASEQPAIESCKGIKRRVPAGAYVIYGG